MAPPLLVLFDVDGTLFLTDDPLLGRSVIEILKEIYGVALPEDAIQSVDHAGQTSKRIARLVLGGAGVDDRSIDARLNAWCTRSADHRQPGARRTGAHGSARARALLP